MNKIKAIILTVCICTSLFLLIDAALFSHLHYTKQQSKLARESNFVSEEWYPNEIVWMGVANDGISTCVVENAADYSMMILPGESIFLLCSEGEKNGEYMTTYSTYMLKEYRIEDGLPGRTIDLTRILEIYPDYYIKFVEALWEFNGEDYIEIRIDKIYNDGEDNITYVEQGNYAKYIYVNLNTGEMFSGNSSQFLDSKMMDIYFTFFTNSDFLSDNISTEFAEHLNNYSSTTSFNAWVPIGCFGITLESIDLPRENKELYSLFPELQKYIGKNGYYIHLLIGNNPDAEYLLRLLMEDGQEISFENLKPISANESIDGEEHIVNSFEEYYQWKDIEWRTRIWD